MTFLEERDLTDVPLIPQYFNGKTVFITGGSGFVGKALIEKLLYSCSKLSRIYILLRSKRGVKPEDRGNEIYNLGCFDRLREEKPGLFKSKVTVIAGDVSHPNLGISKEDRALIVNTVNIIFHSAASVRFDDPLKVATRLNLIGTKEMIALAKSVNNLECFIHVSTSYSNTYKDTLQETLYPPYADWRELIEICDLDDHTLQVMTPKFLGEMANTYVLTKHLAEHMVYEERGRLPVVIMRPSIVTSSLMEPFPGWVDNFNGPTGIIIAGGIGIFPVMYVAPNIKADYVPVDLVVRAITAAAWIRGTKKLEPTDDIPIYHTCAGGNFNLSPSELMEMGTNALQEVPLECTIWATYPFFTTAKMFYTFVVVCVQILPFLVLDLLLRLLSLKPRLVKVMRRIYITMSAVESFTMQEWRFCTDNMTQLRSAIKEGDLEEFSYAIENIPLYNYFVDCVYGAKRCLLMEKIENLPNTKEKYKRLVVIEASWTRPAPLRERHCFNLFYNSFTIERHIIRTLAAVVKILFYGSLAWYMLTFAASQLSMDLLVC